MKTLYLKRKQAHTSDVWGTQATCCQTDLIRATVMGSHFDAKRPMRVIFEWACNGQRIEGVELQQLMRRYPICEFQDADDLSYRAKLKQKQRKSAPGQAQHKIAALTDLLGLDDQQLMRFLPDLVLWHRRSRLYLDLLAKKCSSAGFELPKHEASVIWIDDGAPGLVGFEVHANGQPLQTSTQTNS